MNCFRYFFAVLLLVFPYCLQAQNKVSVYVVAHPDDWQLFMGNDAYVDIQDTTNKVVFIIATSGDATGRVPAFPNLKFARSREHGVLNSVRFCSDMRTRVDSSCRTRMVSVDSHEILCYPYKNVKTYFMRLPDGCFSAGFKGQSLEYLHTGKIDRIAAIDSSATYEGWSDLVRTIRTIIREETRNKTDITVNYQDHDTHYNPNDHPDHTFAGLAASQAAAIFPHAKHVGYMDYNVSKKNINLAPEEIAIKAGIFALADFGITEQGDNTSFDKAHLEYLTRTYSRRLPSVDSAGNPVFPLEFKAFPNPVNGDKVRVQFFMTNEEQVTLVLRNMNGVVIWKDDQVTTVKGENIHTIPLNAVPPGIYTLSLYTATGREHLKLVRL